MARCAQPGPTATREGPQRQRGANVTTRVETAGRATWAALSHLPARAKTSVLVAMDCCFWAVALVVATLLRFQLHEQRALTLDLLWAILVALAVHVVTGSFLLYARRWRVGSFEEITTLAATVAVTTAVLFAFAILVLHHRVPAGAVLAAGTFTLLLSAGARSGFRFIREQLLQRPRNAEGVILFGAGIAGQQLIDAMLLTPDSPYIPVGLLDDDPAKRNFRVRSLRVTGGRDRIAQVARRTDARILLIAIATADSELIRDVMERAAGSDLTVRVLPPLARVFSQHLSLSDIRPVTDADLLGRKAIDTNVESIAHYLSGRRVLVTGAGGSIGSELCAQIVRFSPETLIMLDRDESSLHRIQLSIERRALLDSRSLVLCDIRDAEALKHCFHEHRPEVVFHAAALKHLPLLEMWPAEALKTNVLGTLNVLEASEAFGVSTFLNISTDKAADPTSVLGYSKRAAERLTATFARRASGNYLSVRFGNVLGSRGSMLTTFRTQAKSGGPLTVTHPDVTRYFMTVEEAVQLVIQAGALGMDGEVLVLDMGEPVRVVDVARRLANECTPPTQIVFTGLRPGEKLHETLFATDEKAERRVHSLIWSTSATPLATAALPAVDIARSPDLCKTALAQLCGGPLPNTSTLSRNGDTTSLPSPQIELT